MLRRKSIIKFQGRTHSKRGMASLILGVLVIVTVLTAFFLSGVNKGNGGVLLGIIGLSGFAISIFGFILGIKSFKEKDIFFVAPVLGVGSNGVMLVVLFCLYIVGLVS